MHRGKGKKRGRGTQNFIPSSLFYCLLRAYVSKSVFADYCVFSEEFEEFFLSGNDDSVLQ